LSFLLGVCRTYTILGFAITFSALFPPSVAWADAEGQAEKTACPAAKDVPPEKCKEAQDILNAISSMLKSPVGLTLGASMTTEAAQIQSELTAAKDSAAVDKTSKASRKLLGQFAQSLANYTPPQPVTPAQNGPDNGAAKSVTQPERVSPALALSVIALLLSVAAVAAGPILAKNAINSALRRAGLA